MRFVGVDLGWSSGATGLCLLVLDGAVLSLGRLERVRSHAEALHWIDAVVDAQPALVAVDAPLIIGNLTGARPCERELSRAFRAFDAGCHPANLQRPFAQATVAFSRELLKRGFRHGLKMEPRQPGRYQIEVFPHPASIQLFGLREIFKYKKGPATERAVELERFRETLLQALPQMNPPVLLSGLPPLTRRNQKTLEDQLDALLCAYVGAHWWFWGRERNLVFGDEQQGYIIVPQPPLSQLRIQYSQPPLDEGAMPADPVEQFRHWFQDALRTGVREPNAMTLATATTEGRPSARMVLLKHFDEQGFVWFTNYGSRKARDLESNPQAELVFYWPELERQVRVAGSVTRTTRVESEAYFATRPLESRLAAWASPQSEPLASRAELERRVEEVRQRFADSDPPCPEFWGGYRLRPQVIEFWQGRPNRLHDRIQYILQNGVWLKQRLAP
jgi:pyridoxamine 5'-phosphate oxidase